MQPINRINQDLKTPAITASTTMNGKPTNKPAAPKSKVSKAVPLSKTKMHRFQELDAIVQSSSSSSVEAGKAIFEMETNHLFHGHVNSLKAYAESIDLEPSYATRLKQAGEIYYKLEPAWKNGGPKPRSARQLRAFWKIGKDVALLRAAWGEAVKRGEGKSPTTEMVEKCVAAVSPVSKPQRPQSSFLKLNIGWVPGLMGQLTKLAEEENMSIDEVALQYFELFVAVRTIADF